MHCGNASGHGRRACGRSHTDVPHSTAYRWRKAQMKPCDDSCQIAAKGLTNWPKGSQIMGILVAKMPLNNTKNELNATSILAERISATYRENTKLSWLTMVLLGALSPCDEPCDDVALHTPCPRVMNRVTIDFCRFS